eukprot:CAMPEP_0177677460 /NCGR_PEP_ID=MMETSP0447-20121125/28406_1 /TAXON_ID=0 /ORGANISM="Stygamoeba regulata, Strain BSH-02190019" /LENGTH=107 /DNA_ID=CAMNT_0019186235 /DNA_START=399 /DNA_END=722 /DNA_ORIENTATION=-
MSRVGEGSRAYGIAVGKEVPRAAASGVQNGVRMSWRMEAAVKASAHEGVCPTSRACRVWGVCGSVKVRKESSPTGWYALNGRWSAAASAMCMSHVGKGNGTTASKIF